MEKKIIVTNYEAPKMEVVEIEVEQGFAASGTTDGWGTGNGQG